MKKIYSFLMAAAMFICPATMMAQDDDSAFDGFKGFYRLSNPGFDDSFYADGRYSIGASILSPTNAGQVVTLEADKMYTIADDWAKLDQLLEAGAIDATTYVQMFQQIMTLYSWKSGFYPVKHLRVQGVDYAEMVAKLADYTDDAIEDFLNNDVQRIWEENYTDLVMMGIFTSVIYPGNYETPEALRAWFENYLTKWRSIADFKVYMQPVLTTAPEDDPDFIPEVTNNYYLRFRTPQWLGGDMQKAQTWFNNWKSGNGTIPDAPQIDIWATAKRRILKALSADYPEGSDAYLFAKELLGGLEANMEYCFGENEEGKIYAQPLPDTFGENGVQITADILQQATWTLNEVNADMPFAAAPSTSITDAEGNYYTTLFTDFAYQLQSDNTTAYYATEVNEITGEPTLVAIADGKVPAQTPVIICSKSAQPQDNVILPIDEEVAPISDNVLKGTYYAMENNGEKTAFGTADGKPLFGSIYGTIAANSAYYDGVITAGVKNVNTITTDNTAYDLQGRKVSDTSKSGVYIINGKKVIK